MGAKIKTYTMPREEIEKRYGKQGELAEEKTLEEMRKKEELYRYEEEAMRRMSGGKKKRREL